MDTDRETRSQQMNNNNILIRAHKTAGLVSRDPTIRLPNEIHVSAETAHSYALAVYDGEPDVCYDTIDELLADHEIETPKGWQLIDLEYTTYRGNPEDWRK
jgi:hypothetical protein